MTDISIHDVDREIVAWIAIPTLREKDQIPLPVKTRACRNRRMGAQEDFRESQTGDQRFRGAAEPFLVALETDWRERLLRHYLLNRAQVAY